jgi:hypothetical protein
MQMFEDQEKALKKTSITFVKALKDVKASKITQNTLKKRSSFKKHCI